jgi:hypothetical protein
MVASNPQNGMCPTKNLLHVDISDPLLVEQICTQRKQLDEIHEYARLRGLRHVFDMLPPTDSYVVDHVPPEFSIRNGRLAFLPQRIQIGASSECKVWAYLRLQTGAFTGGTEGRLYIETSTNLREIKNDEVYRYPFSEPLNFFAGSETTYTSGREFRYLVKYLFLKLGLIDKVFASSSNAHEMIAGALRKIQKYYGPRAGENLGCT